ncbi:MAG TPA: heme ABC exporter ATP-binding protein CcmA [Polyangiaceae bacterium]
MTKRYGAVRALMGVSARFDSGRITVVRGPNGSGKSTLLGIVGTLVRPTTGEVDHGALGGTRAEVRRALGWVGHESLCYPDLTGRRNIELAARLHGLDQKSAFARAAERFDLAAFADRPLRTYSRGQRQRIALARGLVHQPALLLLDEPATGLDVASTDRLRHVVKEEAARGAIVVIVTHEDRLTEGLDVRVLSLERGRRLQGDGPAP